MPIYYYTILSNITAG